MLASRPFLSNTSTLTPVNMPSILMITSFPPRECGIATYSQDLIKSLNASFGDSLTIEVCVLHDTKNPLSDPESQAWSLNTDMPSDYIALASKINEDHRIKVVMIQHEFGLFNTSKNAFEDFVKALRKPLILGFHTVIPQPDNMFLEHVERISNGVESIVVMTASSKEILIRDYGVDNSKIHIIHHGTHLIKHISKAKLKTKYQLQNKTVLSTFGLLGRGKSIETTLNALPEIIKEFPDVIFLVLGKTHPNIVKHEGESYRDSLLKLVKDLNIESHVRFVNEFLPLGTLLEYLQLTDIYLFTSNDPKQAVSGTFSYAMSCGCPVISTPIPHAKEFLSENKGLFFDFGDSKMLSEKLKIMLNDKLYRKNLGLNGLHASSSTCWENSALAHADLFKQLDSKLELSYDKPEIKLDHIRKMTTSVGIIQFSKLNQPDISSGYTLDDNARASIAVCETYKLTRDKALFKLLKRYQNFLVNCQRSDGTFLNYVDKHINFTDQNSEVNLEDSNGRAIWSFGNMLSIQNIAPKKHHYIFENAKVCIDNFLPNIENINSPRAIAFIIKGLKASKLVTPKSAYYNVVLQLGAKLKNMYLHESETNWKWFEPYLTYGNSVLSEAMLDMYRMTKINEFKTIAFTSFNFLLSHMFVNNTFQVISNENWFVKGDLIKDLPLGGQQPIDVAYTILALKNFHELFPLENYDKKMELAFSWFMGNNHLKQIIYNPCTTGCFDGLEAKNINLNQGAESTISYLLARLSFETPELKLVV
ncbi:glycosyltransferase [Mariniflexile ostreae]|uniref:Glycosyltransferase n=1 Tax=Mariniflexile ostreae TaxID=1520892 RepID=A0ABV5FA14_9FLAO